MDAHSAMPRSPAARRLLRALAAGIVLLAASAAAQITTYRVNCGGGDFLDDKGDFWSGDAYYLNGSVSGSDSLAIAGTANQDLYKTERWNNLSLGDLVYSFPVPPGDYEVNLHFAEIWAPAFAPGVRVFDVKLNGALAAENLDVFALVGSAAPLVLTRRVLVGPADTAVTVEFVNKVQNAKISGIEVIPLNPTDVRDKAGEAFRAGPAPRLATGGLGTLVLRGEPLHERSLDLRDVRGRRVAAAGGRGDLILRSLRPGAYVAVVTAGKRAYRLPVVVP